MVYDVAADIKIYVQNKEEINEVLEEVKKITQVQKHNEEEVAFGIKILKVTILFDDETGGISRIEDKIRKIKNVSEIEVENVTRV